MNWPGAAARRQLDARFALFDQFGLLDHDHRVGAARDHPAGGDGGGGAGVTSSAGTSPQAITSALSRQQLRHGIIGADRVGRAHGKAVDIGAVERRRVDCRDDVVCQHAAERLASGNVSAASGLRSRCRSNRARASSADTTSRKLLLPRGGAHSARSGRRSAGLCGSHSWFFTHGHGLT